MLLKRTPSKYCWKDVEEFPKLEDQAEITHRSNPVIQSDLTMPAHFGDSLTQDISIQFITVMLN